jgi:type IV pilus assembly protein PilC
VASRRLKQVCFQVEQGEPLAKPLHRHGLLPAAMVPLVQAAERAHNLPWALAELGDHLADRTAVRVRRVLQTFFPLSVFAIGLLIGFVVVGMFLPLLKLMAEFSQ